MYISDSVSEITTVLVVGYIVILIVSYLMTAVVHVFVHLSLFLVQTVVYTVNKKSFK